MRIVKTSVHLSIVYTSEGKCNTHTSIGDTSFTNSNVKK